MTTETTNVQNVNVQIVNVPKFILVTIYADYDTTRARFWKLREPATPTYLNAVRIKRIEFVQSKGCIVQTKDGDILWLSESAGDVIDMIEKHNESP